ncbi:MAG: ABC transporter substrate-binding protein [Anaerolineaceae bacterium]|nr:ABC transporter substrate-binding protein [Anaerolineaceae bacterium]MDE0328805.1 ABC transporter substrate-binding protein [Anaerolineaceae bacterium]
MTRKKFTFALALVLVAGLMGGGLAGAQDELLYPVGEGVFNWSDLEAFEMMDLSGEEVRVFGPWLGSERDVFDAISAYFEEATGADVVYAGSDSFEQQIIVDIEAGSPPNLAVFPQPGLASNVAGQGGLVPLDDDLQNAVLENYAAGQSWVDLGSYADAMGETQFYGFFFNVNVKSLVWYSPDAFDEAGYDIPGTMEDLIALSEQIVADGGTPWCIGLGSGDATGWPATDWMEDIMLRTQPPEVYDGWVSNEISFTDERIINAFNTFGMFAKNDAWVAGGASAVAGTDFRDSPQGLFTVPPGCYMHRQASFIPVFFPEGTELGVDADFFYFPSFAGEDLGNPVLGAGTLFAITADSEATRALLDYLATPLANELWMAQGGFLTPHKGVNLDAYANDVLRGQGEILLAATTFRFDGSDLMPGAIGAGAFWTGMVDFVSGASAEDVAAEIQAAWDAIK